MKSGRRSQSASRSDVLGPATMPDGKSRALSMEGLVGFNLETGEAMAPGEMLAEVPEDSASAAARNIDRAEFLDGHDGRNTSMVRCAVSGRPMNDIKKRFRVSNSSLSIYKRNLAADTWESMGTDVLEAVCRRLRCGRRTSGGNMNACAAATSSGVALVEPP